MNLFEISCEWDIGQEGEYFSTKAKALEWLIKDANFLEVVEDQFDGDIDAVFEAGLVSINEVTLNID